MYNPCSSLGCSVLHTVVSFFLPLSRGCHVFHTVFQMAVFALPLWWTGPLASLFTCTGRLRSSGWALSSAHLRLYISKGCRVVCGCSSVCFLNGCNAHTVFHSVSWAVYRRAGFKHDYVQTGCTWFVLRSCHRWWRLRRERFIASSATATVPRPVLQSSVGTLGLFVWEGKRSSLLPLFSAEAAGLR